MRDFLKTTLASFAGILLFFGLGASGLILLLIGILTSARETGPQVEDRSILTFDLSLNITDTGPIASPTDVVGGALAGREVPRSMPLRAVLETLRAAAEDDRIVGIYLYGNTNPVGLGSGFASLSEVRSALADFQATGKPIIAYDLNWVERDYYLTSIADTIILNPVGVLELNGFRSETIFFAGALEQYGIGIQPVRAGQYKSAVEPFTRTDNSPQQEEQTQLLLTGLWNEFLTTAASSRDTTPQALQAIADSQGLLMANAALEAGLIDQVAYFDEVITQLQTLTDSAPTEERSFRQISIPAYAQTANVQNRRQGRNRIAVVYAEGEIVSGSGRLGQVGGDRFAQQLRRLRQDDDVKAVVLRVNSPGGSATAADEIAREVFLTSQEKPVIVSMGSYAASGGYLIATYADRIFASPNTVTGSIGVFGLLPNVQEIANENGITWDVVKTGEFADIDTISRPKTAAELAVIQRVVNQLYEMFVSSVAESRPISRTQVDAVAQGRVWSGTEAENLGLVDELGGLDAAIQAAAEEADLGINWRIDEYPRTRPLGEQLLETFFSRVAHTAAARDPLSRTLQKLEADLQILESLNDPLGIYTRLPFDLRIE